MIRRINFYGGPCTGKSTTAASIFAELKKLGRSIEYVEEYIKFWTFIPRVPSSFDSLYVQAKQVHKEDTILRAGTDFIVSDSPIMLQYYYAVHHKTPAQQAMLDIAIEFEKAYPSINILLGRDDKDYNELGRYETLDQAKGIDEELKMILFKNNVEFAWFRSRDDDAILTYILETINMKSLETINK
jgi:hypothetical protein